MELHQLVALDCNALVLLCGQACDDRTRVEYLLDSLNKSKGRVLLPTPVIAEFLVGADAASLTFQTALIKRSGVVLGPFDLKAAHEAALIDGAALFRRDKKDSSTKPWQKIKIDRQIVAIAKAAGAGLIVSNDADIHVTAARVGIRAARVEELEFPDSARQGEITYDAASPERNEHANQRASVDTMQQQR